MNFKLWKEPKNEIIECKNVYTLAISEDDEALIDFISKESYDIKHDDTNSFSSAVFALQNKWLYEKLYNLANNFRSDDLTNKKIIKIYFLKIFYQFDSYILLVSFEKPSQRELSLSIINECKQVKNLYKSDLAIWQENLEKEENEYDEFGKKYPELKEIQDKFSGLSIIKKWHSKPKLLPTYEFNSLLEWGKILSGNDLSDLEIYLNEINLGEFAPRIGNFTSYICLDEGGNKTVVVTWQVYIDSRPTYPEITSLIHNSKINAVSNPLLNDCSPPNKDINQNEVTIISGDLFSNENAENERHSLNNVEFGFEDPDEVIREVKESLKKYGFEAFGWYQPHHFYSSACWGIYFDAKKIDELAFTIAQELKSNVIGNFSKYAIAAKLALNLVYQHELFHAKVEALSTWNELVAQKPKYISYKNNVYKKTWGKTTCIEEALANWHSWKFDIRAIEFFDDSQYSLIKSIVKDFLDTSPPGYDQWAIGNSVYSWQTLATQIISGELDVINTLLPLHTLFDENFFQFNFLPSDVPVYFTGNGEILERLLISPSTLRLPPRKELRRVVEKYYGYSLDPKGGKGSHEKWIGKDGRFFIIPERDPVSPPVFKNFLHHFGIDKNTYIKNIRANI